VNVARYLLVALVGCGPPGEPVEPPRPKDEAPPLADYGAEWVGFDVPGEDICKRNADGSLEDPIEPGTYRGILRNARCRQQKLATMAWLSDTLGVDCGHCHVKDPQDPKKHLFEAWTDNKRAANWMARTFVQGLRAVDGTRVACESCHTGRDEKPVMHILGEPRDRVFASEWMHDVMATRFVEADGDRLRCRTCHEGMAPGDETWKAKVILELAREGDHFVRRHLEADPAELGPEPPVPDDTHEGGHGPVEVGGPGEDG
jgi:hypothetical protein